MSVIKVIKRRFTIKKLQKQEPVVELSPYLPKNIELVAIGSSVGGPQALKTILSGLPADFPVPIVIVQHMTQGFINGFAHWLDNNVTLNVKSAENNEWLAPGTVYFAPDDAHMEVQRIQGKFMIYLAKGQPVSGFYPSITMLLKSVVKVCDKNAVGILLTGMGSDGAEGLLDLKKAGSHTLIQDAKSSVVFGMAGVAQSLGAVDKVVELDKLAGYLKLIVRSSIT